MARVKTSYVKVTKKKAGRPKGRVTKRPPVEISDLQQYLREHDGEKPWLQLIEDFRAECDHNLWPQEIVAIKGDWKWYRCTGCRILQKRTSAF
jgi:hypothetical protein